jgi:hypothetical protein
MMLRLMKRMGAHSATLSGQKEPARALRKGLSRWAEDEDFELSSTDLSAASDWIPHAVAEAVWEGVVEALGDRLPDLYRRIGRVLVGPQSVVLNKKGQRLGRTTRGILMGLPLTWPILSLINEFCAFNACKMQHDTVSNWYQGPDLDNKVGATAAKSTSRDQDRRDRRLTHNGDYGYYVIGGDDFAAVWTKRHRQDYESNLTGLGMVVNANKSYYSKQGLVFLEEFYILTERTATYRDLEELHQKGERLSDFGFALERARFHASSLSRNGSVTESKRLKEYRYFRLQHRIRVKLSALVGAKRQAQGRSAI